MLKNTKRTKIVCTLGPASEKEEVLTSLIENGLNVARMNFSHGSHEEHKGRMDLVKKVREKLNKPVAILLDTKGPEIRTGNFDQPEVLLEEGQKFTITMKDVMGTKEMCTVSYKGEVLDDNKPTYGEAFFLMAAASYYHATKDEEAYRVAMETFRIMEEKVKIGPGSYKGGFTRDWSGPAEMRFGGRAPRMRIPDGISFQHHLCQAYEQLYRATEDPEVGKAVRGFVEFAVETLFDPEYNRFKGFMDKEGNRIGTRQSFGHDCEISYLIMDMAELLGDEKLIAKTKEICTKVLRQVLENDFDSYGSLYNGGDLETGERQESHVWWAQAEAVSAMLCGYQLTGDEAFLDASMRQLEYIEKYFVDKENGDWYNNIIVDDKGWRIVDGSHGFDKLNAGKCPFHNSNMCFQVIRRTNLLLKD